MSSDSSETAQQTDSSSSGSESPPPPDRYMMGEPLRVSTPSGFPPYQKRTHGDDATWYNRYVGAWEQWGREVVPHEKGLWIETVGLLRPTTINTKKIHSHGLGRGVNDSNIDDTISWAKVVAVMLNADFFPEVKGSIWMARVRQKFPYATALKDVQEHWNMMPPISKEEAQPRAIPTATLPAATKTPTIAGTPSTPAHQSPATSHHLGDEGTPTPAPRPNGAAADAPFASLEEANREYSRLKKRLRDSDLTVSALEKEVKKVKRKLAASQLVNSMSEARQADDKRRIETMKENLDALTEELESMEQGIRSQDRKVKDEAQVGYTDLITKTIRDEFNVELNHKLKAQIDEIRDTVREGQTQSSERLKEEATQIQKANDKLKDMERQSRKATSERLGKQATQIQQVNDAIFQAYKDDVALDKAAFERIFKDLDILPEQGVYDTCWETWMNLETL
ncbi:uncharacterized protein B0J16DRAFT_414570 [Fusarium flagelliforme]|uniref:uncharacterized protein n=1 Tax=Fusarium flagelliforme TaxID=2675880 RepID=UPI001E8EF460|nr:uncharacterized protein B0J16DRAFT_414570 [Fusarium flagelliforme]KAH7185195.1 hypothetical protein B0J16DRAFT_414570 [Fusarium flagelliforme]